MMGIYTIQFTEKSYVGSTSRSFAKRWAEHLGRLRADRHVNTHLQNAFNQYGESGMQFTILEVVDEPEDLLPAEQRWLDKLRPEYNICPTAGGRFQVPHSAEARTRMSVIKLGKTHSYETKMKIGAAQLGRKHSEETRAKMSASRFGKTPSDETRAKMRVASKRAWAQGKHPIGPPHD